MQEIPHKLWTSSKIYDWSRFTRINIGFSVEYRWTSSRKYALIKLHYIPQKAWNYGVFIFSCTNQWKFTIYWSVRACYTVIMSSHSGHTVQPFRCGKQQCLDHERLFIWVRCDRLFRMYYQLRHCKISVLTGILLQVLHTSAISRLLRWLRSEVSILFCNP